MSASTCRVLVLAAGLLLGLGCEAVAPLQPLSNKDSGSDAAIAGKVGGEGGSDGGMDWVSVTSDDTRDAAVDATTNGDTSDAATDQVAPSMTCDRWTRFNAPNVVVGLNRNPGSEYRISLASDELTAYLSAGSSWFLADLYKAKRSGRSDPFGSLFPLAELNSDATEDAVSVTGDELAVFVDSSRSGRGKIYVATRNTISEEFAEPAEVMLNLNAFDLLDPYVVSDGTALYFTANLDDNPEHVGIYRAAMHGPRADEPTLVLAHARFPVVAPDERTLYFIPNNDAYDVWMAMRASRDAPFDEPVELTELNTHEANEFPQWISPDGCRLYMSRSTATGYGSLVSFVADRVHD